MVIPTRDSNKFWILKFIAFLLVTALISYGVCWLVRSSPPPNDMFYLTPIHEFFTIFIPALTGVVVNFLFFNPRKDRKEMDGEPTPSSIRGCLRM
jgi:uncharacterized membrane protein YgaE (UPF0421/DUF939 family)